MPLPTGLPLIFGDPLGTSLTTLRSRVRERADMPVAGFIADSATSIDAFINEGVQILYEKLVIAYGPEYTESTQSLTTAAGTTDYALPADFFKMYGVDLQVAGKTRTLLPFEPNARNVQKHQLTSWRGVPKYQIVGANLRLLPDPGTTTGTIRYAQSASVLVDPTDTVSFPNGWERYAVLYAAIQCLLKEESDVRELQAQLEKWDREIDDAKQTRDMAFPHTAVDVDNIDDPEFW